MWTHVVWVRLTDSEIAADDCEPLLVREPVLSPVADCPSDDTKPLQSYLSNVAEFFHPSPYYNTARYTILFYIVIISIQLAGVWHYVGVIHNISKPYHIYAADVQHHFSKAGDITAFSDFSEPEAIAESLGVGKTRSIARFPCDGAALVKIGSSQLVDVCLCNRLT